MTIKRMIFRAWVRTLEYLTLAQKPKAICHLPLHPLNEKSLDIITVAFNNVELIQYQEQFLRKFIQDPYHHIVVDNSTDLKVREQLFHFCLENKIAYISLPKNFLNWIGGSYSHAAALNYVYKHIIVKRQPFAFGQIDHDLFPTRPISIINKLSKQPIYGPLRLRDRWWYLSAIMSFFQYDFVKDKKVDFMPVTPDKVYLDSGGGNWYGLYSQLDREQIVFPNECIEPLREGGDRHGDSLEFFDDKLWLHTINGSCWKKVNNQSDKDNHVREYLDTILA
jgi:hypothetical protein